MIPTGDSLAGRERIEDRIALNKIEFLAVDPQEVTGRRVRDYLLLLGSKASRCRFWLVAVLPQTPMIHSPTGVRRYLLLLFRSLITQSHSVGLPDAHGYYWLVSIAGYMGLRGQRLKPGLNLTVA